MRKSTWLLSMLVAALAALSLFLLTLDRGYDARSACIVRSLPHIKHDFAAYAAVRECRNKYSSGEKTLLTVLWLPGQPSTPDECIIKYADKARSRAARGFLRRACFDLF